MDKFFIVFNIFVSFIIYSQERKTFDAVRFDSPPIIDGILNDNQWTKSKKLDDFILALPETRYGKKIPVNYESTAFFGYDNNAIYIAAILKHPNMEKIQNFMQTLTLLIIINLHSILQKIVFLVFLQNMI